MLLCARCWVINHRAKNKSGLSNGPIRLRFWPTTPQYVYPYEGPWPCCYRLERDARVFGQTHRSGSGGLSMSVVLQSGGELLAQEFRSSRAESARSDQGGQGPRG